MTSIGDGNRFEQRYELKSQAGTGGMGVVYQAIDRETGRLVAVKILHSRSTVEQARFEQEARVLSELSHPGIVRYVDHGMTPRGMPYLAMEWLEGETLEDRMSRGFLGAAEAAQVAGLVLQALSAAHAIGVVHRDIKPSNIFLVGGSFTDIRVLDFGIARRVYDLKRFTRKGSTVGTPLYTSPEQARGRGDLDGRSDIFSLGCVFFEVLTGEPPFSGDTPLEVMTRVCAGQVPPISSRRPGLPPALEALIHHMLQPQPSARPQFAKDLAVEFLDLARRLDGQAESLAVPSPPPLVNRPEKISDGEEHLVCAMMLNLARRTAEEPLPLSERRLGPRPAFPHTDPRQAPQLPTDEERLRQLRSTLERYSCALERLVNRTFFVSAQGICSAEEQALLLATVALIIRDLEPDATIALGTGRAAFRGRLPQGRLMERLPGLLKGQSKGSIRVDETTQRLLPSRFAFSTASGERILLAEVGSTGTEKPREIAGQPSPFLGRERDLSFLSGLWRHCREEKNLRVAFILGEVGFGKSRLVREFLASLGQTGPAILRTGGTVARSSGEYASLRPLYAASGVDVACDLPSVPEGPIVELLSRRCGERGLILVVEDLQWAEQESMGVLDRALAAMAGQPVLVLAVGRPEVEERFPGLFAARSPEYLRLRPLGRKHGETLVHTHVANALKQQVEFILDRWGGNPRFAEEICSHAAANMSFEVPEVVQAMVEPRFDGLDPDARRLLRIASLFGDKAFGSEAAVALLGESARKGLSEWFEILVMRGLLERDVRASEAEYRFTDRLVRESVYRMLSPKDRLVARNLARAFLVGAGHTLPETLTAPLSQTSKLVANS